MSASVCKNKESRYYFLFKENFPLILYNGLPE